MAWISGLVEMVDFYSTERSIDGQMEDRVRVDLSIWRVDDGEIERDLETNNTLSVFRRDIEIESDREHYISSIPVGDLVKFEVEWDGSEWDGLFCSKGGWVFCSFELQVDDEKLVNDSKKYLKITNPENEWDYIETTEFRCKANAEQYNKLINALVKTVEEPWGVMRSKVYTPENFDRTVRSFEKTREKQFIDSFDLWPISVALNFNSKQNEIGYRGDKEFHEKFLSPACVSLGLQHSFTKEKITVPYRLRKEPIDLKSVGQCKPKYEFWQKQKTWLVEKLVSDPIYVEGLDSEMVFEIDIRSLDFKNSIKLVDQAITKFLKAGEPLILEAEDYLWSYHYFVMEQTGSVSVRNKEDLWKEFYFPRTVQVQALESGLLGKKCAYLELSNCSCGWETHGLDLGFLNGNELIKVAQTGGSSLSEFLDDDSDVFGISSEYYLIDVEDTLTEENYPNYDFPKQ